LAFAGCSTSGTLTGADVARGAEAYRVLSVPDQLPPASTAPAGVYRIGPNDKLNIAVFQEPELSTTADAPAQVDSTGSLRLPLVGTIMAAGKTSDQVASIIAGRLASQYLKNPQVTVSVADSAPQKITVQCEVTQPGVFEVRTKTSLLEAIALARGETRLASTNEVAVFRTVGEQRLGALFNVDAIRRGVAPDPELMANDVVIVGHSRGKQMWQDILSVSPLFGVFRVVNTF
jgi:polysaccharide export outer membrane protein